MARRSDNRDVEIGKRLRALRLRRGRSQIDLGKALGVTFQQIQKYERGTNRISATRLQQIADVFDVPIMFFFEGVERRPEPQPTAGMLNEFDFLQSNDAIRMMQAFARIKDRRLRRKLLRLAEGLVDK